MRVFVAGSTGVMGRPLLPALVDAGHEPIAMTRSPEKAAALREQGIETAICDAYDAPALARELTAARPDAVVHLLTDLPAELDTRHFERAVASTGRLRREGTRNLLAAARAADVGRVVAESIAFAYEPTGDWIKDEDAPLATATLPFVAEPLAELERQVLDVGGTVMRYGQLYGPGTAFASDGAWAKNVRRRQLPIVGSGGGVFSFLHVDDAASATVAALAHEGPATYNVVDDDPAPVREWAPVYARTIHAPRPWRVPAWVGRIVAGSMAVAMMQELRGASGARFKAELGWQPRYASWREGFAQGLG
ncbi:MAG TPA: NAD(P)-dependent oxidoreductase [Solirubrobacteraceae bacterium]|nr:NAD(P)-dependent oxidoreductase [Solirubrobacteraceae bacterium]